MMEATSTSSRPHTETNQLLSPNNSRLSSTTTTTTTTTSLDVTMKIFEEKEEMSLSNQHPSPVGKVVVKKNTFPYKTFQMIQYCHQNDPNIACWSINNQPTSSSSSSSPPPPPPHFIIKNSTQLEKIYIPKYYLKKSKFTSFIRQLNNYGFRNVTSEIFSGEKNMEEEEWIYFKHDYFQPDRIDLLKFIHLPTTKKSEEIRSSKGGVPKKRKQENDAIKENSSSLEDDARIDQLEHQVKVLTASNQTKDDKILKLEQQVVHLVESHQKQTNEISSLQNQVTVLSAANKEKTQEIHMMQTTLKDMMIAFQELKMEMSTIKQQNGNGTTLVPAKRTISSEAIEGEQQVINTTTSRSVSPNHHLHHQISSIGIDEEEEEEVTTDEDEEEKMILDNFNMYKEEEDDALEPLAVTTELENDNDLLQQRRKSIDEVDTILREMEEECPSLPMVGSYSTTTTTTTWNNDSFFNSFTMQQQQQQERQQEAIKSLYQTQQPKKEEIQSTSTIGIMDQINSITTDYYNNSHSSKKKNNTSIATSQTTTTDLWAVQGKSEFSSSFHTLLHYGLSFFSSVSTTLSTNSTKKDNGNRDKSSLFTYYTRYLRSSTTADATTQPIQKPSPLKHKVSQHKNVISSFWGAIE